MLKSVPPLEAVFKIASMEHPMYLRGNFSKESIDKEDKNKNGPEVKIIEK